MYKNQTCSELVDAIQGDKGDLDAYLEVRSEAELRVELNALVDANRRVGGFQRDEMAVLAASHLAHQPLTSSDLAVNTARRCYRFADEMVRLSKEGNP